MRRRRAFLGWLAATVVVVLAVPVRAGEPPTEALGFLRDYRLTFQAQRALAGDRALAPLKLEVKVRNGVAEVSGTAPSPEVARRAADKLYTLKGVADVRSRIVVARPAAAQPRVVNTAKPLNTGGSEPVNPTSPARTVPVVDRLPPAPAAPVRPVSTARPRPLRQEIERVRSSDPRFRNIRVEVRDRDLLVYPGNANPKNVNAFCQALEDGIPGVNALRTSQ